MQTRSSVRNQKILWKALGGQPAPKPATDEVASLERILARNDISRRDRAWFERGLQRAKARAAAKRAVQLSGKVGEFA